MLAIRRQFVNISRHDGSGHRSGPVREATMAGSGETKAGGTRGGGRAGTVKGAARGSAGRDPGGTAGGTARSGPEAGAAGLEAAASATPRLFVSSSHLVSAKSRELSEFEFGLIIGGHAFNRWVVRCMAAAGLKDLTTLDVLLLHHVNHRAREKKLADIAFMLNIEDTHVVAYALKKLAGLGLVQSQRRGKEVLFATTAKGQQHIAKYREVREACLVASLTGEAGENFELAELAHFLRRLSGLYDQAARAAASL
jgi:predicted MarR family transcription regulator